VEDGEVSYFSFFEDVGIGVFSFSERTVGHRIVVIIEKIPKVGAVSVAMAAAHAVCDGSWKS
jgi:hypothetical protein